MAYSLAMKKGITESRDLQVLLVGAENTGKTCLVSSFLGEEFVKEQVATEAVCKIYCEDWTRITYFDKTELLHLQFSHQLSEKALDMVDTSTVALLGTYENPIVPSIKNIDVPSKPQFVDQLKGRAERQVMQLKAEPSCRSIVNSGVEPISSTKIASISGEHLPEPHPLDLQEASSKVTSQHNPHSLNIALWDFPGQVIFHNFHSVFFSASGVVTITFNASMKLADRVVPRDNPPTPPECSTIISSIHYWLQVVDSVCSVENRQLFDLMGKRLLTQSSVEVMSPLQPAVILAGTHIDLLHPDIKVARKIAKEKILPQLIEELSNKHYAQHLVGMGEGIEVALEQFCFFVSNKYRDEEIERLKSTAIKAATSLKKEQPIYFLKIERALLQQK